jgi:hypothetical protein
VALSFLVNDESQLLYYEKRLKEMPVKALKKHGLFYCSPIFVKRVMPKKIGKDRVNSGGFWEGPENRLHLFPFKNTSLEVWTALRILCQAYLKSGCRGVFGFGSKHFFIVLGPFARFSF